MQQQDLDFSIFKKMIDTVQDLQHIELQGEGEPLLHPQFFEMVDYIHTRFPTAEISFITNGSLFTTENISRILNSHIHTILISVESPDEDEFQQIRGGKFSRVKRGIKELVEQKNIRGNALKIGLAVTVLKQTLTHINKLGELYTELKLDGGINIQPLQGMDSYIRFYSDNMKQSLLNADDRANLNSLIATDRNVKTALRTYQTQKSFYAGLLASMPAHANTCPWLENGLYLSANGIATSCCYVKDVHKNGYGPITEDMDKILESRAQLARRLALKDIPPQCKGCGIAINLMRRP